MRALGYQQENAIDLSTTFYLATNEDSNVCGDNDRQTAIERLLRRRADNGLSAQREVPRSADYIASIIVREGLNNGRKAGIARLAFALKTRAEQDLGEAFAKAGP